MDFSPHCACGTDVPPVPGRSCVASFALCPRTPLFSVRTTCNPHCSETLEGSREIALTKNKEDVGVNIPCS